MPKSEKHVDPEVAALQTVIEALRPLNAETQVRIIDYVCERFGLPRQRERKMTEPLDLNDEMLTRHYDDIEQITQRAQNGKQADDLDTSKSAEALTGVSPVAQKWMARNDLDARELGRLFTLGVDDIDLVAKALPGKNASSRFREVVLLEGVAAYLSGGVARFTHQKLKGALPHYNADPGGNFTTYIKRMAGEVSGSAAGGYTLTNRGLHSATELVKDILGQKNTKNK